MAASQIKCINKLPTHQDRHRRIQAVCGADGVRDGRSQKNKPSQTLSVTDNHIMSANKANRFGYHPFSARRRRKCVPVTRV